MSCIRKIRENTLDIRLGISDDPQRVDDLLKIKSSLHYKVIKARHRKTGTVNIVINGEANEVKFEHDGNQDNQWKCEFKMPPKYKNGVRYITDPKFVSAKLRHNSPGDQDCITTDIEHKLANALNPDKENRTFFVDLV